MKRFSFFDNSTYHDKWFLILFVPFANTINYFLSYSFTKPLGRILLTYTLDTIEGYISLFIIRYVILLLDRKIGYFENLTYRLSIQITLTSIAGLVFIALITELIAYFAGERIPVRFYFYVMPIFFIWILLINGVYLALYFYHHLMGYQQKLSLLEEASLYRSEESTQAQSPTIKPLVASIGRQEILLDWKDILCIYVEDELTLALNNEERKYIIPISLEKTEMLMDNTQFFRLNRQFIIHRSLLKGISKEENGKLSVFLKPTKGIPELLSISRTKAPAFKKWMKQS